MTNRQLIILTILIFINSLSYSQNTKVTLNSVNITLPGPGQWKEAAKNEAGGQWMFKNENSKMTVSLSARQKTKFDFYKDSLSDFKLVSAFYKWDADYWASDKKNEVTQIKTDKDKKYVVWRLKTPQGSNLILNGLKADNLIGIQIPDDSKLADENKIKILEAIYLN